jgi:hypothetical protein
MPNRTPSIARRHLLKLAPLACVNARAADTADPFPAHPYEMIREMVTVSHGNFKRAKELVDARPALARAAVDWGFGDWEDALGAASHVGNREIAEYLISKGARPSLFSAAMLGQLDVVKALLAAQSGAQRIEGPHSISLLAHAKAGGKAAEPVYQFLESLGDAGSPKRPALPREEALAFTGVYVFGSAPSERIEILEKNGALTFTRKGAHARNMFFLGERTFHPAGASAVRIRFTGSDPISLTVHDPDLIVTARRIP